MSLLWTGAVMGREGMSVHTDIMRSINSMRGAQHI